MDKSYLPMMTRGERTVVHAVQMRPLSPPPSLLWGRGGWGRAGGRGSRDASSLPARTWAKPWPQITSCEFFEQRKVLYPSLLLVEHYGYPSHSLLSGPHIVRPRECLPNNC